MRGSTGYGCVRIIHGKGLHGDSGAPVLKNLVDRLLRQRADVLAFHSRRRRQGGTGAVLVLLARCESRAAGVADRRRQRRIARSSARTVVA